MQETTNTWIILVRKYIQFIKVAYTAGQKICISQELLRKNEEFSALKTMFNAGPESFWKKPSGIRAGRSVFSFIYSFISK